MLALANGDKSLELPSEDRQQPIKVEAATEPQTQTESVLDKIKGILPLAFTSLAGGSSAPQTQTQEP